MSNLPVDPTPRRTRRELSPQSRDPNTLRSLYDRAIVSFKLMFDNRVSLLTKLIPVATIAYVLSPVDFIPELLVGPLGAIDDVGIVLLGLTMFMQASPPDIVQEHLRALRAGRGDAVAAPQYPEDDVIDGEIME
jgi:uncharacterized membrane protein YkvA (DUF1232 family)